LKGKGEIMPLYLASSYLSPNFDPSTVTEAMIRDIDVMNEELVAAGARIFGAGLSASSEAKSLRAKPDGKVVVTDGPYLETKEHVGGFIILKAANLDEALAWGRKFAAACRTTVEIRPFLARTQEDNQHIPGIGQD
jgi:hypothetical protein